jgi:hypothetical protein
MRHESRTREKFQTIRTNITYQAGQGLTRRYLVIARGRLYLSGLSEMVTRQLHWKDFVLLRIIPMRICRPNISKPVLVN